jgi:hypothetical protein
MIRTKTMEFWGFSTHPFADNILRGNALRLFVGRQDELYDVEDALGHSRVVGVHGSLGVGKSSFLHKLREKLERGQLAVAMVHLTADSQATMYREILAEVLTLCKCGVLSLKRSAKVNIGQEIRRLEASTSETWSSDIGAKLVGLGADVKGSKTTQVQSHTESSALTMTVRIFDAVKKPVVVILDDFEKLQYEAGGQPKDYFSALSRFVATLEERMNRENVSFVVSLDEQFTSLARASATRGGAFSYSLNDLKELRNLSPHHLVEFIKIRLRAAGWRKGLAEFLPLNAFWALSIASDNHPRRVLRILAEAVKAVAKKRRKAQLSFDVIVNASQRVGEKMDERTMRIVEYLGRGRGASESDEAFLKAVGLRSRSALSKRLSQIADSLGLVVTREPSGKTFKVVYSLPDLDYR